VGLAASYDRINRFDLADRAYSQAIKLVGETVDILNNQGYSYMLRGDLVAARKKFLKAYERDPSNPTVVNNLKLLDESARFIRRNPEQ
jgi:Flp pilus assembly protein TadD